MVVRKENMKLVKFFLRLNYLLEFFLEMFLSSYLSFKVVDIFLLFLKWAIYSDVYEFEDCLLKLDDFDNDLVFYKRKV